MQSTITLRLLPSEAASESLVKQYIALEKAVKPAAVTGYTLLKHSVDARGRQPMVQLSLLAFINEPYRDRERMLFHFRDTRHSRHQVVIIGAGPAGLFAALKLIESGIRPILLERGKDVKARRRDLALLNKAGELNPESNYCFGEGGAGTYSDGKLYTRSTKRGDVNRILELFVEFGAGKDILYEAHPHIGTNKLPSIITAMREKIEDCGGKILFHKKVVDFILEGDRVDAVLTEDKEKFTADAFILATGHSARDIFRLLHQKKIRIFSKPFALGVRVEHPQALVDCVRYHLPYSGTVYSSRDPFLPPAAYNWVEQISGKAVFSFCMCPGGIIAPAATSAGELVVNGWSPSKRNNPFANSGIVVSVEEDDLGPFQKSGPLAAMHFQQSVEKKAFDAGGGKFVAPGQRLVDFTVNKRSGNLPACSYLPGVRSVSLKEVLPGFIHSRLREAFREFGKKMKGYLTNDAIVVATESRTSSPVRIPRSEETFQHPQIGNLFPCGEGAGYAGGIVSAAMDGEKVAGRVSEKLLSR